jgi:LysR family glycine cleavage system transcriptional activator
MKRDMPSLNAVRMFEAAARYQNFTRAADALFVTQGAVSRQVKQLEVEIGCELFRRDGPKLHLTDDGARFYAAVTEGLGAIRRGTLELKRALAVPSLTISVLPSFAAKWLVQRVVRFQAHYQDIEVRISTSYDPVDFDLRPDIDAAIRWGQGNWPGTYSECLLTEKLFPVCSPGFVDRHRLPSSPAALAELPLIRPIGEYDQWDEWFRAAAATVPVPIEKLRYSDALLLQQAALEGHGVALARSLLVDDELKSGRLVRLFDVSIDSRNNFYFVCPSRLKEDESLRKFLGWLRDEARQSGTACEDLCSEQRPDSSMAGIGNDRR